MIEPGTTKVRLDTLALPGPDERLYTIQIGAFVKPENAFRVQYGLRTAGIEAVLEKTPSAVTRVLVEPVREQSLAQTLKRVAALGFTDCLVREKEAQ